MSKDFGKRHTQNKSNTKYMTNSKQIQTKTASQESRLNEQIRVKKIIITNYLAYYFVVRMVNNNNDCRLSSILDICINHSCS